ncbi:hypothetical protein EVAR_4921_1 [Eumeta japonica]|uniref:Uncharacterized protein n=1 Tax=Eumeta variegata TaxID=151549 RepID=A0A4C1XWJ0_EUMVA|nr:hypothetical protein EVAR_4921_1 [Eumeta japonica]
MALPLQNQSVVSCRSAPVAPFCDIRTCHADCRRTKNVVDYTYDFNLDVRTAYPPTTKISQKFQFEITNISLNVNATFTRNTPHTVLGAETTHLCARPASRVRYGVSRLLSLYGIPPRYCIKDVYSAFNFLRFKSGTKVEGETRFKYNENFEHLKLNHKAELGIKSETRAEIGNPDSFKNRSVRVCNDRAPAPAVIRNPQRQALVASCYLSLLVDQL